MDQSRLRRCPGCGELEGEAVVQDRNAGLGWLTVICICRGIPCSQCGKRLVRRPVSNHYEEATDSVWHTPWFGYLFPCLICRRNGEASRSTQAVRLISRAASVLAEHLVSL